VRPGIDTLRDGRFFGRGGEIGAVAVFGRQKENNSYLLHGEANLAGVDLLALGGNLRGRDLLASISHDLHPLVTLGALGIWNLRDDSFLLRPLLRISLGDNLSLELFWSINRGASPKRNTSIIRMVVQHSEFGSGGDGGGILLKHFFRQNLSACKF
jgi:hypothetical protein